MRRFILCLIFSGFLAGCYMYSPDIQQGNVITAKQTNQLKLGMSQEVVKKLLGDPMLINTFADDRLSYIYTYQHKTLSITEPQIILTFKNNRLVNIKKRGR